jgi:ABC-type transport system involved in cytochrome c biogenesis permease subunit
MKKYLPWVLLAVSVLYFLTGMHAPAPKNGFDLAAFGRLPVLLNGRIQPLDTVGRNSLLQIRTRQTVALPDQKPLSATEWLLEVLTQPEVASTRKIFRIDNGEVLSLLKLPAEEKYFSYQQLAPMLDELERQSAQVDKIENAQRTSFQRQLIRLYNSVNLFSRLKLSLMPEETTAYADELERFQKSIPEGVAAFQAQAAKKAFDQAKLDALMQAGKRYERLARAAYPMMVPPLEAEKDRTAWKNVGASLMDSLHTQTVHPALMAYARMADAWRAGKAPEFNQEVARYNLWLQQNGLASEVGKSRWEFFFQQTEAFYHALTLYLGAFLVGIAGMLLLAGSRDWGEALRRSAFYMVLLTLAAHTAGLVFRMVLEGRPPVTNLYSSAVFIGWAAVVLGVVLERLFKLGIGNLVASAIGFTTLVIAHNLALSGDTMEMMRAVLDSNFWLSTHVVTVTLGYSATFVAGGLAVLYVLLGVFSKALNNNLGGQITLGRVLSLMVYGVVAFATLFSFIGTVTGGIWADQSWGRFWGWDVKENGALLIVIWNAAYLHARWGSVFKERGLMNMAIIGNIVTAWSWFGVNMLGVGLHSYGFMDQAFVWLVIFWSSQLIIIGVAMVPLTSWKSFAAAPGPPRLPADLDVARKAPAR